ncbi:MAG: lysylphosphatidylglycerol synthase transmembrane domain-containing protein [Desulfobacterales bacterium]|nr:lysylphosphatidylglycerol synthase transmembrane domain-containing protein [Desulfobacterales bacterium]
MKKKLTLSLLLGAGVSAAALYFAFKNVPFKALVDYLAIINYWWVVPSVAVALLTFVIRAIRWQVILGGKAAGIGFWQAFHPMMIGFMINCILPGRAGEVARPIILSKKDKVPFTTGLATVAAERVFDIGLLIAFFAVVLANVRMDPDLMISYGKYRLNRGVLEMIAGGMLKASLVLVAGIVLLSLEKVQQWIKAAIYKIPSLLIGAGPDFKSKVREKLSLPLARLVENFAAGFGLIKRPLKIVICILLSFLVWYLSALSYYLMALGCPGINLTFLELSAVMIIVCFFIALPSVPGFWGIWEAGGVFALSLFGVPAKEAAGMTLVVHAISVFPVIIGGLISAVITGINIWRITYTKVE